MILGTPVQLTKVVNKSVKVGGASIASCDQVRNLGVIIDKHMKMDKHISKVCKTGFYYIFNLKKIRKHMSSRTMSTLVHSFIHSHLDYCNSLLHGVPGYLIQRLQRLQNSAARLVVDCYDYTRYTLRSSNTLTLTVPRTKMKTYGDRAFPSAGPKLWNGLPISVRSSPTLSQFKSCLKTHFFKLVFC
ncbi:putative RNA-directed DNA polymerase from mobile element jockey-like [Apostichopus japonicus]|uniref:Putative RNA-directed DNA polymerase from mobile element jockey-like n=1 Tax=Stichopus japonicus TaxID=307972 RepID=A0A2G8KUH3_STIJA|nr:putative RNA-directed DNA polymerase from mobile element jockey-like [Apostichopus japonicus]